MPFIKPLPSSGFYAVIFVSTKNKERDGYAEMDELTMQLAVQQPGYLGYESSSNGDTGIFISYWESREAITAWRDHATHRMAKDRAVQWYRRYLSQVCFVESSREFTAG